MIQVGDKQYESLFEFEVSFIGWEMDNDCWIVKTDKGNSLVNTNHGKMILCSKNEADEFISERISETEKILGDLFKARELLK